MEELLQRLQNYKTIVEIFKGYLDTALTVHTSYYALTGALAAYYLANRKERPYVRYALILPFFLGLTLAYVSFTGMRQALTLTTFVTLTDTKQALTPKSTDIEKLKKIEELKEDLKKMSSSDAPPVAILWRGLLVTGILDVMICLGAVLLFFWPPGLFSGERQADRGRYRATNIARTIRQKDKIADWFDSFLFFLLAVSAVIGLAYITKGYLPPEIKLFAFDWGKVWEVLAGLGLTAAIGRGGYAVLRRFKVEEKYYKAIFMVLDDAPYPIPREDVKKKVKEKICNPKSLNPVH